MCRKTKAEWMMKELRAATTPERAMMLIETMKIAATKVTRQEKGVNYEFEDGSNLLLTFRKGDKK